MEPDGFHGAAAAGGFVRHFILVSSWAALARMGGRGPATLPIREERDWAMSGAARYVSRDRQKASAQKMFHGH